MIRAVEVKIYPTERQSVTLRAWMDRCAWIYNQALAHRIKAYQRRRQTPTLYSQFSMLATWRSRMEFIRQTPSQFARDALRRVDRGMKGFFRRCNAGEKPGFPRFRPKHRYTSLEVLEVSNYIRPGGFVHVPKLGLIKFRGGCQSIPSKQVILRIIQRASGWFAQVLFDNGAPSPTSAVVSNGVGVDVGLESFATTSDGEVIENPRLLRAGQRKLRSANRRVSRRIDGSANRRKAAVRRRLAHERIAAQRKDFAHQHSRRLVNAYDLIGFEKLNMSGMVRGRLAKSILDAAWSMFLRFIVYKAESAGKRAIAVNARGSSQECPRCGRIRAKSLRERVHRCECGLVLDRDHAAALVILARALGVAGATPVEGATSTCGGCSHEHVGPVNQEVLN